ncbi:N-acetylmuramate alpha-1-phosphate uridylyltransferase MurU [Chitinivorax tropicus]|nr:nucleotidyltransferase family protein [Chitinivorax tropicus]
MILAAGRGERMRPLTDHTPKPLLRAGSKALIEWHVERLVAAGVDRLVINHAHLGGQIVQALGNGARFGAQIAYSAEETALETAGGIAKAMPLLGVRPFIVVSADVFCQYDFTRLIPVLQALGAGQPGRAHLVMVPNAPHHPQGDFGLADGMLSEEADVKLTYSGIGCFHPAFFATVPAGATMKLVTLLKPAIAAGLVSGECHNGLWLDVGTPERLALADQYAAQMVDGIDGIYTSSLRT